MPVGDFLLYAGDSTINGDYKATIEFIQWINSLDYKHVAVIAGNHDVSMEKRPDLIRKWLKPHAVFLDGCGEEIGGWKLWGSGRVPRVGAQSSARPAGVSNREHWRHIPVDTQVLLTHTPPDLILDQPKDESGKHLGCPDLLHRIPALKALRLHCFGHIHSSKGVLVKDEITYVNAAYLTSKKPRSATIIDL